MDRQVLEDTIDSWSKHYSMLLTIYFSKAFTISDLYLESTFNEVI